MELGAQTALLLALRSGPGFGLELIERVWSRSRGGVRLNRGGAYLALRALERQGLVHGWMRRTSDVGRPRRYYELTPSGIVRAEEIRKTLVSLLRLGFEGAPEADPRAMADRVSEASAVSLSAARLRDAARRAGLP